MTNMVDPKGTTAILSVWAAACLLRPQLPIERAILNRFGQVLQNLREAVGLLQNKVRFPQQKSALLRSQFCFQLPGC